LGIGQKELEKHSILALDSLYLRPLQGEMKRLTILFFSFLSIATFGQLSEFGLGGGGTNFIGDVGNYGFYAPQRWYAVGEFRHQFDEHYAIRASGSYGQIYANDAQSSLDYRNDRNYEFRSNIFEAAVMMEFNFLPYITGSKTKGHSSYLFGGIGLFTFNPQGKYNGDWVDLQPLSTEGQGTSLAQLTPYGRTGFSLPFGMGYRVSLGKDISMAFEVGFRTTSTDYLDDVSHKYVDPTLLAQEKGEVAGYFADRSLSSSDKTSTDRGNSLTNDWYVFTGIKFFFAITPKKERCKRFR